MNAAIDISAVLVCTLFLSAYSSDDNAPPVQMAAETASGEGLSADDAAEYRKKVSNKINDSIINSLARDPSISKEQAQCIFRDHRATEILRGAQADPVIRAVIEACGVDPALVK